MSLKSEMVLPAVDAVIAFNDGSIVLVERATDPCKGQWALPGGILRPGLTVEQTLKYKIESETGLQVEIDECLGYFDDPERDPMRYTMSLAFKVHAVGGNLKLESDAGRIIRTADFRDMKLAFDHSQIVKRAFLKPV